MGHLVDAKPFVTELKVLEQLEGSVMHGMKASDPSYVGFGEAYFSTVNNHKIKGWKLHKKMTLNLIVPIGDIRFVVHDASEIGNGGDVVPILDIVLGESNYSRLSVPPGFWLAFQGLSTASNMLLNIADVEHNPSEAIQRPCSFFRVRGFNAHD